MSLFGELATRKELQKKGKAESRLPAGLGSSLKPDLGRVAQRVKHAQQKVLRNVSSVVVHDGRNAGS